MKNIIVRYAVLAGVFLVCVALTLILLFNSAAVPASPCDQNLRGSDGKEIASVSIADLHKLGTFTMVNYTPDEFLLPVSDIRGTPVDLTKENSFAQRGTFIFVVRNIDPMSDDFFAQSEALAPYLQGDGYWHFTLYLPQVWSACNIYIKSVLTHRVGEIENYDFIKYSEYSHTSVEHVDRTEPLFIDLSFYPRQQAISPDPLQASTVITIHYESESVKAAGIEDLPLIGENTAVRTAKANDQNLSTALYVIGILICAMYIFVCLLKKTLSFLPHLFIDFGIFGILFSSFMLTTACSFPFFWENLRLFMFFFTLFSAFCALRNKNFLFRPWHCILLLMTICTISFLVLQVIPYDFSAWEPWYRIFCNIFFSLAILIFAFLSAGRKDTDIAFLITPVIVGCIGIAACLPNLSSFASTNPIFWLAAVILVYTACLGARVFISQEQKLRYLTKNLHSEVHTQTKEMKVMIDERDQLLRYVSHDMKKPVQSMQHFLKILRERETDNEQKKTIDIITRKTNELSKNLSDIASYSRNNFAAEESKSFDLNELIELARQNFEPDCTANGIYLKTFPCHIYVYAKYKNLYSVISNIILNSIEHADCRHIWISAQRKRDRCILAITDDGKGIDEGKNVFYPYYSESFSRNNTGLGLYLAKNFMQSMNGDLTYTQEDKKLTFFIDLPLA